MFLLDFRKRMLSEMVDSRGKCLKTLPVLRWRSLVFSQSNNRTEAGQWNSCRNTKFNGCHQPYVRLMSALCPDFPPGTNFDLFTFRLKMFVKLLTLFLSLWLDLNPLKGQGTQTGWPRPFQTPKDIQLSCLSLWGAGCYTDFKDEDTEAHGINNLLKTGCRPSRSDYLGLAWPTGGCRQCDMQFSSFCYFGTNNCYLLVTH